MPVIGGPMDASQRDVLRGALEALTHDGSVALGRAHRHRRLLAPIARLRARARPVRCPRSDSFDSESPLARGVPDLEDLGCRTRGRGISMILADDHGQVLDRHVTDKALMSGLDEILLAPGFVYSERGVGTNGIGTALAQHAPTFVRGAEHFSEGLTTWACAGAPIIDPCTGRVLGVIDLTCRERDASPLMLPLVRRAAAEICRRLIDNSGPMERAALRSFLQQHGKSTALAFVSQGRVIANAHAEEFISSADEPTLWFVAARTLERRHRNGASHPQLRTNDTTSMRTGGRWQHADRRARTHRSTRRRPTCTPTRGTPNPRMGQPHRH